VAGDALASPPPWSGTRRLVFANLFGPVERGTLLLSISTATGNNTGIGKQLWDYAGRVLDGTQQDERLFALVHAADPKDAPWEVATWFKANPS
jgi:phage terminase large subunit-like protein